MSATDPLDTFREEAGELLQALESALMKLETDPDNSELIDEAFRSLHTIKGSGNMFGLDPLVSFTHSVEAAFALARDGSTEMSNELAEVGLQAGDHIALLVNNPEPDEELLSAGREILDSLRKTVPELAEKASDTRGHSAGPAGSNAAAAGSEAGPGGSSPVEDAGIERTFRIRFVPNENLFRVGTNPLLLTKELRELGEALVIGYSARVPDLHSLDPEACYLAWDILLTTTVGENDVRDVFIFVEGDALIDIQEIDSGNIEESDLDYKRLGEILVARGDLAPEDVERAVNEKSYLGDVLVDRGYLTSEQVDAALKEQAYVRKRREDRRPVEAQSSIKVSTDKMDTLVNLVGEFVSVQATLSEIAGKQNDLALRGVSERMEALIRDVRDLAMDLRMVPVDTLFSTFRRLIRDLSRELGKEVNLEVTGTDTELDKNVIERLKDPLLHIIRNSLDHGLESPEAREGAGKPRAGVLHISADYSGASVIIRVSDDGKGLNREAILRKAIERGVVDSSEELSASEIDNLIFAAGFSTTEKATNVSGRGVGMDVVRSNIEELGGSIAVESETGVGTTMSLRIPLTLAIVEGLLVRASGQHYLVNMANVLECLDYSSAAAGTGGQMLLEYRGRLIPYVDLVEHFELRGGDSESVGYRQLLVVDSDGRTLGLVVDEVLDTFQSVVKSLGKMYEHTPGVSGAVVLGNGDLALLLDVDRLTAMVSKSVGSKPAVSGVEHGRKS